jgi:hypothetical protein
VLSSPSSRTRRCRSHRCPSACLASLSVARSESYHHSLQASQRRLQVRLLTALEAAAAVPQPHCGPSRLLGSPYHGWRSSYTQDRASMLCPAHVWCAWDAPPHPSPGAVKSVLSVAHGITERRRSGWRCALQAAITAGKSSATDAPSSRTPRHGCGVIRQVQAEHIAFFARNLVKVESEMQRDLSAPK